MCSCLYLCLEEYCKRVKDKYHVSKLIPSTSTCPVKIEAVASMKAIKKRRFADTKKRYRERERKTFLYFLSVKLHFLHLSYMYLYMTTLLNA